jgi:hypothetical protein
MNQAGPATGNLLSGAAAASGVLSVTRLLN